MEKNVASNGLDGANPHITRSADVLGQEKYNLQIVKMCPIQISKVESNKY
jgi:hypothetical protein